MQIGFTKKAEEALGLAAEAAGELGHNSVGTEHILLGLFKAERLRCKCCSYRERS